MRRTLIDPDQGYIRCRIWRRARDYAVGRRTDVGDMPTPDARGLAELYCRAVSAADHMGCRNRPPRSDKERGSPRFCIHAEERRARSQQAPRRILILRSHSGPPPSPGRGAEASRRSQEAVTLTCAVPPASASTLSSAPVRAVISIPNSTVRESGRCSSMAWRTDATTPRTVSANPGRHNTSVAGVIRCPSPTSAAPAAPSPVAAGAAPCTRTHIGSPLGSITRTISDVVPPSHFGDPALRNILRVHLFVKTLFWQRTSAVRPPIGLRTSAGGCC